MRTTAMIDGNNQTIDVIPDAVFWDDYYESLHIAHNALRDTFDKSGLNQDELASRCGVSKSYVSKRLNGEENLTIKTLARFGTGMSHRLVIMYQPYSEVGQTNFYYPTPLHVTTSAAYTMSITYSTSAGLEKNTSPKPANTSIELEKV